MINRVAFAAAAAIALAGAPALAQTPDTGSTPPKSASRATPATPATRAQPADPSAAPAMPAEPATPATPSTGADSAAAAGTNASVTTGMSVVDNTGLTIGQITEVKSGADGKETATIKMGSDTFAVETANLAVKGKTAAVNATQAEIKQMLKK